MNMVKPKAPRMRYLNTPSLFHRMRTSMTPVMPRMRTTYIRALLTAFGSGKALASTVIKGMARRRAMTWARARRTPMATTAANSLAMPIP